MTHVDAATDFDSDIVDDHRIYDVSSTKFAFLINDTSYAGNTVPAKINSSNNLQFYPINVTSAKASDVVTFITNDATAKKLVTATLVPANGDVSNDGSAQIDKATSEEFYLTTDNASLDGADQQSLSNWPLFDGVNWVQSTDLASSVSSTLSLKTAVSGELASNADFTNESMRLVPITAQNLVNFLSNSAVSGFYSNGTANRSSDGRKLQLTSDTMGSSGAIQVTGGTGNLATATIFGSGQVVDSDFCRVLVPSAQIKGFTGNKYVKIQGTSVAPKITPWNAGNTMEISASVNPNEFLISFNSGVPVNVIQAIGTANTYQIEKQGNFIAYVDNSSSPTSLSGAISEGDWVYISVATFNATNTGFKQIVRIDPNTFWVENASGVEEIQDMDGSTDFIKFLTYDSIVPGDTFSIGTTLFGSNNVGNWTVSRLDETWTSTTATNFYVSSDSMSVSGPTTLGSDFIFIQAKEENPIKLFKKINTINLNTDNTNYYDIIFDTSAYANKISSAVGSIATCLDKLDLPTSIVTGLDGYSYNTGLLAEVNKVVYGDETNPDVYPGIAAAGASINITGPLVKRIQVSLEIRFRTGVSIQDVSDRVRSAVASVINSTEVGTPIALGNIVAAAQAIDGVYAVTILSPTYNSGNDMIAVQPSEKPLVLNIETDVLISVARSLICQVQSRRHRR